MHQTLVLFHSLTRWLVLASLMFATWRAYRGYFFTLTFTKTDNAVRHWTATFAHVQLFIGIILYTQSPVVKFFWNNFGDAVQNTDLLFFGMIHITLMLVAIVFVTIGSALAKRKAADREKFKTQLLWFSISLLIIFIAIPWPFSPLAERPFFR